MPRKPKNTKASKDAGPLRQNARHWFVTQHDTDAFWKKADPQEHYAFKYMAFQTEECPKTGNWHIQAFVQFTCQVRGSTVQRLFGGSKPHIEVSHHPAECRLYCMKEETRVFGPEEWGVWEPTFAKGFRTDLTVAKYNIRIHANYRRCLDDDALDPITSKYPKWVADQLTMVPRFIKPPPVVICYYGPTQTGKTYRCHMENPGVHEVQLSNKFINYSGQEKVLFDEFDKDPWPFGLTLKLLDRFPFQINIKNGYSWWEPTHIFLTASTHPREWFLCKPDYREEYWPQLERRFTSIIDTTGSTEPLPPPAPPCPNLPQSPVYPSDILDDASIDLLPDLNEDMDKEGSTETIPEGDERSEESLRREEAGDFPLLFPWEFDGNDGPNVEEVVEEEDEYNVLGGAQPPTNSQ